MLMKAYKHNLGRTLYNSVAGRFGGWKGNTNRIEGINKGLMELNQAGDEVFSQVFTNIRNKYWPNLIQTFDPAHRTETSGAAPKAQNIQEGQNIAMWKGETVEPIFKPVNDDAVPWLFEKIQEQVSRLGGSPVLFGARQPGVETGYHQALQITQSEHLDDKLEQHLAQGAVQRALLVLSHVKAEDQDIPVHHIEKNSATGRRVGKYLWLRPMDLFPLPRLSASVRKPRPVDFAAAMRTAADASSEREGKGPLMDDDTIRESILNMTAPDEIRFKVLLQKEQNKLIESGVLSDKIAEAMNLKLAQKNVPEMTPEMLASADPAVLQALQGITRNQAAVAGGVSPQVAEGSAGRTTGMPTGQSQPEANAGQEISVAERV